MFKKVLSVLLVSLMLVSNSTILAAEVQSASVQKQDEELVVPKNIENEIYNSIIQVYGESRAQQIYDRVMDIAKTTIEKQFLPKRLILA